MAEKPSGERCGGPAQLARTCQSELYGGGAPSKNQGARAVIPFIFSIFNIFNIFIFYLYFN